MLCFEHFVYGSHIGQIGASKTMTTWLMSAAKLGSLCFLLCNPTPYDSFALDSGRNYKNLLGLV